MARIYFEQSLENGPGLLRRQAEKRCAPPRHAQHQPVEHPLLLGRFARAVPLVRKGEEKIPAPEPVIAAAHPVGLPALDEETNFDGPRMGMIPHGGMGGGVIVTAQMNDVRQSAPLQFHDQAVSAGRRGSHV